jgi:hypothetical protein
MAKAVSIAVLQKNSIDRGAGTFAVPPVLFFPEFKVELH